MMWAWWHSRFEDGDGGGLVGEEPSPVLERGVRADGHRAFLVGNRDEPEEELGEDGF